MNDTEHEGDGAEHKSDAAENISTTLKLRRSDQHDPSMALSLLHQRIEVLKIVGGDLERYEQSWAKVSADIQQRLL